MGRANTSTTGFVKKESDFNWLAKPPRKNYLKLYPLKGLHHHLDIHKL